MESELRRVRKAIDLSQEDVAFLLGNGITGSMISRHENGERHPNLFALLGYRFILGREITELYQQSDSEIRTRISSRALELSTSLQKEPQTPKTMRRISTLQRLLGHVDTTDNVPTSLCPPETRREDHVISADALLDAGLGNLGSSPPALP